MRNKPFSVAGGVTVHRERDILGIWAGDGGESAKFWLGVLTRSNAYQTDSGYVGHPCGGDAHSSASVNNGKHS